MWATLMSGAHMVWHAAGWLEGGLTMSYEKFVMDLDHCGMMLKMLQGLSVEDETLARDAYLETRPGENFLSTTHTMRNFSKANYQSELPEGGPYEAWVEKGSKTVAERANILWKDLLANYEAPPMEESDDEALKDFMARRKAAMPDTWY